MISNVDHWINFTTGRAVCGSLAPGCGVKTFLLSDRQCGECRRSFEANQAEKDQTVKPQFPDKK